MAVMKLVLGLLVLFAVSAWTEAMVVNRTSRDYNIEDEEILSVSERLQKVNRDLKSTQDGVQIQGDIVLPNNRNADPCVQTGCKWPKSSNGKVYIPYVIANSYSARQIRVIKNVFRCFSTSTCIRFICRTTQKDYIKIKSLEGCYSNVGRQGNGQIVSLNNKGCVYFGIIQHELIHALGFEHEQSRSDRDKHIKILLQNVLPGMEDNFEKVKTLNLGTPYDYNSVMHYDRLAFSKDNVSPTMVAIPDPNVVFGTATKMSQNDINRINRLYC